MKYNQPVDFTSTVQFETDVLAPTLSLTDNSDKVATTSYVNSALAALSTELPFVNYDQATLLAQENTVYLLDTTLTSITVTLPLTATNGSKIVFLDSKGLFDTNSVTVNCDAAQGIGSFALDTLVLNTKGEVLEVTYWDNLWVFSNRYKIDYQLEYVNSSISLKPGIKYLIDSSLTTLSLSLPGNPPNGSEVYLVDYGYSLETNNVFISSVLDNTIGDLVETSYTLNVNGEYLSLIFWDGVWIYNNNRTKLTGTLDYISYDGPNLAINPIDLSTDTTGLLPIASVNSLQTTLDFKVDKSGSSLNNQIAVWNNADSIRGSTTLTFDDDYLTVGALDYATNGSSSLIKTVIRAQTVDATTQLLLTTDNLAPTTLNTLTPPLDTIYTLEGELSAVAAVTDVGSTATLGDLSSWDIKANIRNVAGTITVTDLSITSINDELVLTASVNLILDVDKVSIAVNGLASTTINWLASVELNQISW